MDEAGHDLLGSLTVGLHEITAADMERVDGELDGNAPHKASLPVPASRLQLIEK